MIYIFTGKPRAGKSYLAMLEAYRESIGGSRHIVMSASMGIKAGEWNALVQKRHPDADFDPHKRLRLLNDDEVKSFWRCRMHNGESVDYPFEQLSVKAHPTLFIIDEAHLYFDARCWKETGQELTKYNSQHAKIGLGDVVIFITQFPDLLDKRIKGFAQEWHCCTNLGFQKIFMFFRMPQRFLVAVHYGEPTRNAKPSEANYHKIDMGVANCYDTSSGVGVVGRNSPEMKKRTTGVSWKWLVVVAALAVWGISYGPDWFMKHVLNRIRPGSEKTAKQQTQQEKDGVETIEKMARHIPSPRAVLGTNTQVDTGQPVAHPAPYIRGVSKYGTRWRIELSDGRVFTDETGGVTAAGRDWVRLQTGEIVFRRYPTVLRPDNALTKKQ